MTAKKGVIVLSSPRQGSNSSALAMAVGYGLSQSGVLVSTVDLTTLNIKPCLACDACQGGGGKCGQLDHMQEVYPKILEADILLMATPIYWFNVSGQLKTFLDRCYAISRFGDKPFSQKTLALAFAFADEDVFRSGGMNAVNSIRDICQYSGARWGGYVYGVAESRGTLSQNTQRLAEAHKFGQLLAT
ncbi:MAG: flavodoxin family protein [Candidatus Adiutrix sp.]